MNIELLSLQCRPFYLPREISCVVLINVYIPPDADTNEAASIITDHVNKIQNQKPDAAISIMGDFNKCTLSQHLPKFLQFVTCTTRKESVLDLFYCNMKHSYKCQKLPPIGDSDHNMLCMLSTYRPKLKSIKPVTKTVKSWTRENIESLKACFEWTNWEVFMNNDDSLDNITDVISSYISFCADSVVTSRTVKIYGNSKPWVNKDLRQKFKEKSVALRTGNKEQLKVIQAEIDQSVKLCKKLYKDKIENQFKSNDTKQAWRGLETITGYSTKKSPNINVDINELNKFYARFDDPKVIREFPEDNSREDTDVVVFSPEEVCKQFRSVNPRKAAGPDGVSSSVIKNCAEQLSRVFCGLYNRALSEHIPTKWKEACIIPVPKSATANEMNDFRPVALTSIPMKCLERLVLRLLKKHTEKHLDALQFAYRSKRGTEDALLTFYDIIASHLSKHQSYARVLMIDFSSAFNTVLPEKMISVLRQFVTPEILCKFVWDFLTARSQYVKCNNIHSESITINTGSPQGCVMSAYLFSLYTSNCRSSQECCLIFKYADDTAIVALITDPLKDEASYRQQIEDTAKWCRDHNLLLNTKKTKELVYDIRRKKPVHDCVMVNNNPVEQVATFRYLGVLLSNDMTWNDHISAITSKAHKRLFFLRKLKQAGVSANILEMFYKSVVMSVMTYCIVLFYDALSSLDKSKLSRLQSLAQKIIGSNVLLTDISSVYDSRLLAKILQIYNDVTHPLNDKLVLLPSGRRLRSASTKSVKYNKTFVPTAIKALNRSGMIGTSNV